MNDNQTRRVVALCTRATSGDCVVVLRIPSALAATLASEASYGPGEDAWHDGGHAVSDAVREVLRGE